jgi:hypothetical protein
MARMALLQTPDIPRESGEFSLHAKFGTIAAEREMETKGYCLSLGLSPRVSLSKLLAFDLRRSWMERTRIHTTFCTLLRNVRNPRRWSRDSPEPRAINEDLVPQKTLEEFNAFFRSEKNGAEIE